MHIQTRLLNGFQKILTYKVPQHLKDKIALGSFIVVPLRNKETLGYVVDIISDPLPAVRYKIKHIIDVAPFPDDKYYKNFLNTLGRYYIIDSFYFIKRLRSFLDQHEIEEQALISKEYYPLENIALTNEQQHACDFIAPAIKEGTYQATLLHGVTGSGKTEIYKKLILQAYEENKSVIFLVPEVTLAVQFFFLLKAQLPDNVILYQFHSASTAKEKKHLWNDLLSHKPLVIVGVHLPIMLPIKNLGLIIVDEEHETGYQEKKHPKLNTKEAALLRASIYNIPILLGSATPSIASLYQASIKKWHYFKLLKRYAGNFPHIKIVNLLDKKKRDIFWISSELDKAIIERLARKEQIIIFLNRRGYSFFVLCKLCSYIFICSYCSVSLTLHEDGNLRCHYCNYKLLLPSHCSSCKAPESELLKKGIGTQQLSALLQKKFPTARIGRADLDTTTNKKKWRQTLDQFERGDMDILVGTQTITKGYHFPRVTLVGIIWADANLHFPKYNATETALQQLIQVAGRAGRQTDHSMVIVQTFSDNYAFKFLDETKYYSFYEQEIERRKIAYYPPFIRFLEIELKNDHEQTLAYEAEFLTKKLIECANQEKVDIRILGPALPPISKIKNIFSRLIYIKSPTINDGQILFSKVIQQYNFKSSVFFTPNVVN